MKQNMRRNGIRPVVWLLLLLLCLPVIGTLSVRGNEIEQKKRDVEQKKQELQQKNDEELLLQKEKETATENEASYRQQVTELNEKVVDLQAQQVALSEEITATETKLEEMKQQKKTYEQSMQKRIQFLYEDGQSSLLVSLLQSASIAEFMSRFDYISDMSEYDQSRMKEYAAICAEIDESALLLADKKQELETVLSETQTTLTSYESMAEQAKQTASAADAQQSALSGEKQKLSEELAGDQAELDRLLAEAKAAEEAHAAAVEAARKAQEEAVRRAAEEARRQADQAQAQTEQPDSSISQTDADTNTNSNTNANTNTNQVPAPNPVVPSHTGAYSYTADELDKLTAIVYCEAGGEPYIGQVAVASVILNRVDSSVFSNSIEGVILEPYQFSPTIDYTGRGSRYQLVLKDVIANPGRYSSVRNACLAALGGEKPVGHYLFFHTIQLGGEDNGTIIGNHVFYEVWVQHDYN
ncbi:MAG: cell wall hydrolase [Eubacteriales bacterium]|nr:cell wall hydrolase [Eubacteriales bacterium]